MDSKFADLTTHRMWAVYDADRLYAVELTEAKARARRNLMSHADKVTIEAVFLSSATLTISDVEFLEKGVREVSQRACKRHDDAGAGAQRRLRHADPISVLP